MAIEKTYSMIQARRCSQRSYRRNRKPLRACWSEDRAHGNGYGYLSRPPLTTRSTRVSLLYDGLISYITSGPVVKMVVSGEGAVAKCRSLMGATNPAEAAPGTIRGDFGLIMDENVIHGSDSVASAERESPSSSKFLVASFMERRNICFGRNYATRALDDAAVGLNSLGARGALDGGFPAVALIRGSFDGKTGTGARFPLEVGICTCPCFPPSRFRTCIYAV